MPHSNFKWKATKFNLRVGKCSCGQTFGRAPQGPGSPCALERDMNMKLRMHRKFCYKTPRVFDEIRIPKKATTLRGQQLNEYERMKKVHN